MTEVEHRAADEAAIAAIIRDVERGFNDNDPELSTTHFADDAVAVTATGRLLRGRAALLEANRTGLAGPLRDATAHYRLDAITFLAPDVAIAHKLAWSTTADAELRDPEMIALYVFGRRDGRWQIIARHNTATTL